MSIQKFPKIIVAGLLERDGKYLLVKEVLADGKETWIVPGGKVEFGESLEEALKRELKEEVNMDVDSTQFVTFKEAIFPTYNYHTVIFFYRVTSKTKKFTVLKEEGVLDAQFFAPEQLNSLKMVDSATWLFQHLGVL